MNVSSVESAAKLDCFHCGLPVPPGSTWSVQIEGADHALCCPGCEAVAQTILDNGLSDYYRTRTGFSPNAGGESLVPPELSLYDQPEVLDRFAEQSSREDLCEATFSVEGIRCAACIWLIERRLAHLSGVETANLNVATERLDVRWQKECCKPSDILKALRTLGYTAYPFDAIRHGEQLQRAGKTLFRQLFVAGLSMMQVMMYAVPAYIADDGSMDADMADLLRWASLLLTLPAVFYSALPFFKGAWASLKGRALGMDVPVALGIAAAFIGSTIATVRGAGEVYFDTVTMFVFLLLCSRYLELVARRKAASALEKLQHALPASAFRMAAYPSSRETETVSATQLRVDDIVLIKPGESIAADCTVIEGNTSIDMSLLTGESLPVRKYEGETLPGGAVNAGQAIVVRVTKPVQESTLSTLVKLVERAGQAKPQLSLWADKVAAWFVAALLLFAVCVFGLWQWIDADRAWPIAIAVLVVSCPCALSLATPTALAAATERLLRQGVLVVQPHVIETLHRATHIIFDKTGTLTAGKPGLRHLELLDVASEAECLGVAAGLETSSAHPLGQAIVEAARQRGLFGLTCSDVQHITGQGVEGRIGDKCYRLGNARFVEGLVQQPLADKVANDATSVYLGTAERWLARLDLVDAIRPDARDVVNYFCSTGKELVLLSGDQQEVTQRVASELGIAMALGECLPEAKLAFVQRLQENGAVVAMAGDGINDAAVLRAADVSFAMGGGAALAQTHADAVLLSGRLQSMAEAAKTASKTMAIIRQNLAWASFYNLLAIPAAAIGLLNPWLSGIGMSLSSAVVVVNALRLLRWSHRQSSRVTPSMRLHAQQA